MTIDWRVWLTTEIKAGVAALDPVPTVKPAGSIDDKPPTPFIEINTGTNDRGPFPGVSQRIATVWIHDEPGTYLRIDAIIAAVKLRLVGADREKSVAGQVGANSVRWLGDSQELSDDGYGTITRNVTFQLNGKE